MTGTPAAGKLDPDAVPMAGVAFCAGLALSLSGATILTGLGVLAAGVVARLALRRRA